MKTNELETIINEAFENKQNISENSEKKYLMLSMKQLNLLIKEKLE